MLTAIRSFANECVAKSSELDEIDYGDSKIILEVGGYCYIAVVVQGEPSKQFIEKIRTTLGKIIVKHGKDIETYNGDQLLVSNHVEYLLENLIDKNNSLQDKQKPSRKGKPPTTLLWLLTIFLSIIFVPLGLSYYRSGVAKKIEKATVIALDATPELSVYRLIPQVKQGKLTLTGRVTSETLRGQAAMVVSKIAQEENLKIDNQIIAVNVPPDINVVAQQVQLVTSILNQQEGVALVSRLEANTVNVEGFVLKQQNTQPWINAFKKIPGVNQVSLSISRELPTLPIRIYFQSGLVTLNYSEMSSKLEEVKKFLEKYPHLHLRLIGYSDRVGLKSKNQNLALNRANSVKQSLIDQGVDSTRLQIVAREGVPLGITPNQPLWLSRCVLFEPFITVEQNN
jgi:outer membrane protein OmpA-like peptidoglycan-associated protein